MVIIWIIRLHLFTFMHNIVSHCYHLSPGLIRQRINFHFPLYYTVKYSFISTSFREYLSKRIFFYKNKLLNKYVYVHRFMWSYFMLLYVYVHRLFEITIYNSLFIDFIILFLRIPDILDVYRIIKYIFIVCILYQTKLHPPSTEML